jgi:hypothetical protein
MLGAGLGLLLSGKLSNEQRRAVGWTLVAVGAITTIPLVMNLVEKTPKARDSAIRSPRDELETSVV